MYHTTTPDEPGWYWIAHIPEDEDGWQMAFWDIESTPPRLLVYSPESISDASTGFDGPRGVSVWVQDDHGSWRDEEIHGAYWRGPSLWVGPLGQPGGPFGEHIIEVSAETYGRARKKGYAVVMRHIDYSQCPDRVESSVTTVAVCPEEVADRQMNV